MNDELLSLALPISRRGFITGIAGAGFALAVQPINAQSVIATDSEGLTAGDVKIAVGDFELPAYRAMPAKGTNLPTVLVVQEIFGVHEHIKDVCRRLAKQGYLAIAPELYVRQGNPSTIKEIPEIVSTIVSKVPDAQVMADLDAAAAWAVKNGGSDRLAITGFCWGGRIVWMYAAHNPKLRTGAAWYGRVVGPANDNTPKHPVDVAASIKAPILGLYGGADTGIPVDTVEKMQAALKAAGSKSEFKIYADAPHAFHADYRASYRKEAAEDGWKRLLEWFKAHGV